MRGAIPPLPQYAFMAWCSTTKHRDNFYFTCEHVKEPWRYLIISTYEAKEIMKNLSVK
jgi:hypothetical protein